MGYTTEDIREKGSAVALGYFDGIHRGHRAVLNKALECAEEKGLVPVVLLFDIHPRKLVSGIIPPMLMSESKKRERLIEMGFTVVDFDFREGINFTAEKFASEILEKKLNVKAVCCGYDYRYGKGGKGNPDTLRGYFEPRDVKVFSMPPVVFGGETISSTRIRKLIIAGQIERANTLLGDFFCYDLTVERGDGLGHTLGFPTINQFFPKDFIVPFFGVYASTVKIDGKRYPAVTNVGIRPTVASDSMRSETCIIDFSGDLYGKNVEVSLLSYLRSEIKFKNLEGLQKQVEKDKLAAAEIYREVIKNG